METGRRLFAERINLLVNFGRVDRLRRFVLTWALSLIALGIFESCFFVLRPRYCRSRLACNAFFKVGADSRNARTNFDCLINRPVSRLFTQKSELWPLFVDVLRHVASNAWNELTSLGGLCEKTLLFVFAVEESDVLSV